MEQRGRQKVSVRSVQRTLPRLKHVGRSLIESRLHDAELAYLRRRRKSKVAKHHLKGRVDYCHAVKLKHASTLKKWAYTDGTVYYIDRTAAELEQTAQAALGSHVWRHWDGRDALFEDCIGPSAYQKAQGTPIRIWGMLACGHLSIHVLDAGEVMNEMVYIDLVEDFFEAWAGNCEWLVQDFERCLRTEGSVQAIRKAGLELVEGYPRCSQDFNAIENAWKLVRDRLFDTLPTHLETRDIFIKRLTAAVAWINRTEAEQLWFLSTNQKQRADACLSASPPGGRTKW